MAVIHVLVTTFLHTNTKTQFTVNGPLATDATCTMGKACGIDPQFSNGLMTGSLFLAESCSGSAHAISGYANPVASVDGSFSFGIATAGDDAALRICWTASTNVDVGGFEQVAGNLLVMRRRN